MQSELLHAKDELLAVAHDAIGAEKNAFREAADIAGRIGANFLRLLAATGLAPLLRDTIRRDEARAMLGEIYNWFTEGFDTADLKDAKAPLDQLNEKQDPSANS